MAGQRSELDRFRDKLDRELRSGVIGLVLLTAIERTGPVYGYRLLSTVQEHGDGRIEFKEGTAYPQLQRFEKMGFVSSFWSSESKGPPRKYYQITETGRRALEQALLDWRELTNSVEDIIDRLDRMEQE